MNKNTVQTKINVDNNKNIKELKSFEENINKEKIMIE